MMTECCYEFEENREEPTDGQCGASEREGLRPPRVGWREANWGGGIHSGDQTLKTYCKWGKKWGVGWGRHTSQESCPVHTAGSTGACWFLAPLFFLWCPYGGGEDIFTISDTDKDWLTMQLSMGTKFYRYLTINMHLVIIDFNESTFNIQCQNLTLYIDIARVS
jgi:hypothetical protein